MRNIFKSKRKLLKKIERSNIMKEARQLDYNKDGDAIISVGLIEADEFFSPYSYKTYELLNPAVVDYIASMESEIPVKDKISLDIYTEEPTTNIEKKRIKDAVKRHNAENIIRLEQKVKHNAWSGVLYTLLGILVLVIEAIFWDKILNTMLDTVIAILGWLFLWDGVEILVFEIPPLKRDLTRCYRLMAAKIHVRQYSRKIKRMYNMDEEDEEE